MVPEDRSIEALTPSSSPSISEQVILDKRRSQDTAVALLHYAPSLSYVAVALVYGPLLFAVRESSTRSVWIAFCLMLVLVGVMFSARAVNALHARSLVELAMLRSESAAPRTDEKIWGDRLDAVRQVTRASMMRGTLLDVAELVVWLAFATVLYFLAR